MKIRFPLPKARGFLKWAGFGLAGMVAALTVLIATNPVSAHLPGLVKNHGTDLAWLYFRTSTAMQITDPHHYLLPYAAYAAMEAGNFDTARKHATILLDSAATYEDDYRFYGVALHDPHIILGRLALREGNLSEARRRLMLAGQTPGSATLNSFGPNLSLAHELLIVGETKAVSNYLTSTSNFWELQNQWLPGWEHKLDSDANLDISDFHLLFPS